MKEDNLYNYVKETNKRTHIIINSCKTQEQLTSASRYTKLLWGRWKEKITHKGEMDVVDWDLLTTLMDQHHKRILRKEIEIEISKNH